MGYIFQFLFIKCLLGLEISLSQKDQSTFCTQYPSWQW